jgi:hypothetical protein
MKLTASQLRQIIREELSQLSGIIAEDKYTGYMVGNDKFDSAQEAIDHCNRVANMSEWDSSASVVNMSTGEEIYTPDKGFLGGIVELLHEINPAEETVYTAGEGADGKLIDEEYRGSRDDTQGKYGNWEGFPASQAEALAKKIARAATGRSVMAGTMGNLINHVRNAKYGTSNEAKKDIIQWLVDNDSRRAHDFRNV